MMYSKLTTGMYRYIYIVCVKVCICHVYLVIKLIWGLISIYFHHHFAVKKSDSLSFKLTKGVLQARPWATRQGDVLATSSHFVSQLTPIRYSICVMIVMTVTIVMIVMIVMLVMVVMIVVVVMI